MSFEIECPSCGALSSPSLGACPYCKTVIAPTKKMEKDKPLVSQIKKYYTESKMQEALYIGHKLWKENEKAQTSPGFLVLFAKVLFETESYPAILNSVLGQAAFIKQVPPELTEIKEIIVARGNLTVGRNDFGEIQLMDIIKRNPKSAYAHFVLGTHLYFTENDLRESIFHLEECVKHHPKFLRAWGCLGAIYKALGKDALAARAFREAAKLENNRKMKDFFKSQV
jgi:tetratricopeptide (TPR) repeat protein